MSSGGSVSKADNSRMRNGLRAVQCLFNRISINRAVTLMPNRFIIFFEKCVQMFLDDIASIRWKCALNCYEKSDHWHAS